MALAVLAFVAIGTATEGLERADRERLGRFSTTAVFLTGSAPTPGALPATQRPLADGLEAARWAAPDGTPRVGVVSAVGRVAAAEQRIVWTNRAGDLVPAPFARTAALGMALVLTSVAGVVLLGLGGAARRVHAWLVAATWAREWAVVEPRWSAAHCRG